MISYLSVWCKLWCTLIWARTQTLNHMRKISLGSRWRLANYSGALRRKTCANSCRSCEAQTSNFVFSVFPFSMTISPLNGTILLAKGDRWWFTVRARTNANYFIRLIDSLLNSSASRMRRILSRALRNQQPLWVIELRVEICTSIQFTLHLKAMFCSFKTLVTAKMSKRQHSIRSLKRVSQVIIQIN